MKTPPAGLNKVSKEIDKRVKRAESVSDETKAKAAKKARLKYYSKLKKANNQA